MSYSTNRSSNDRRGRSAASGTTAESGGTAGRANRSSRSVDGTDSPGDPVEVARIICLQQLAVRARSRAELFQVLARRGVPDDAANHVLDRFQELDLINDVAFAEQFSREQYANRGLSKRVIANRLQQKGVAVEDSAAALERIDAPAERAAALRLAERKLRTLDRFEEPVRQRRLFGFLARRGYSTEVIQGVLRELAEAEASADN